MGKPTVDWHGLMPAIVTPFDRQGRIDEEAFRRFIDINVGWGVSGIITTGCTGESWAMTVEERKRIAKIAVDQAHGRIKVLASTSAVRIDEVIELTEHAKSVGCEGVMVMPPFFPRLHAAEDIIWHYRTLSDAVDLPIMVYNVPGYNVNEITPDILDGVADVRNVVAIKESTTDWSKFYNGFYRTRDRLKYFTGQLSLFGYAAIQCGVIGAATGSTNCWGPECLEFLNACLANDQPKAVRLQKKAVDLWALALANHRNLYPSVKAMMNLQGLPGGYPRPPLRPIVEPELNELREGLVRLGFKLAPAKAAAAE